mmetsp:Transcript_31656/g.58344  ORF Transcript_31656/g.58344 Transcript_31656/m.58344 type:complete len:215 (-) Transcript_31656:815-1459(-)
MRNQIKSLIFDETSIEESKDAPVASSESLYHLPTLWSESVKENKLNKPPRVEEDVTDTTSDNSSNFSESDGRGSSIMSRKSLAFALNYDSNSNEKVFRRPRIVGHRGSMYHEPENTIPSFQAAQELGAEAVELDVFLLKCGRVAVFHGDGGDRLPGGLKKYCDVEGSIMDCTAEQARKLAFTENGNAFVCPSHKIESAKIPMLDEVSVRTNVVT